LPKIREIMDNDRREQLEEAERTLAALSDKVA
jgi:hypothetical protein